MYRNIIVSAYDEETIKKIDELRASGVNITELVLQAIRDYKIETLLEEKGESLSAA